MSRIVPALLLSLFLTGGCSEEVSVSIPDTNAAILLAGTGPVSPQAAQAMEGVYEVVEGKALFGEQAVVKWSGNTLSIFTAKDVGYGIFETGTHDSILLFAGYWRKMAGIETGPVQLTIAPEEGGNLLFQGLKPTAGEISLRGWYNDPADPGPKALLLRYRRPLYESPRPFHVIAHRAGGRNSDRLPASENSVELVRLAGQFGADGVEIDVRMTADGVPVIFHDEYLNLRLNRKNGLVGELSAYTLDQLETFVRLIHGERIPTLQQMLGVIIRETELRFVWLDIKPGVPLGLMRKYQEAFLDSARLYNRSCEIFIGLPDDEAVAEFLTLPGHEGIPALCELDPGQVRRTGAYIWAPRWTLGTQNALVAEMHAEGRRAFVWTLDVAGYIHEFLREGDFDGILTNYPSLAAFYHYVR